MHILQESGRFILWHRYESIFLRDKQNGQDYELGDHYGDPKGGLISPDDQWVITWGEGLLYFDFERGLQVFFRSGFPDPLGQDSYAAIHAVKVESGNRVRILLDPWSEYASTWLLDLQRLEVKKIADGPSLMDQPFQEHVDF